MIHFESGVIPFKGMVTSLKEDSSLEWQPWEDDQKRAMFRIKKAFDVTMTSQQKYLEIQVAKTGHVEQQLLLPEICISVREIIEKKLEAISTNLQASSKPFRLAFKCTCPQKNAPNIHLMTVDDTKFPPTQAECLFRPLNQELSKESHLVWFVSELKGINLPLSYASLNSMLSCPKALIR